MKVLMSLLLLTAMSAQAQVLPGPGGKQIDVAPLVRYLKENTHVLTKPVHLYSYFQAGGDWKRSFSADDPVGYRTAVNGSKSYWANQGDDGGGNMYGRGLYVAVDPVATRSYGGIDWVLLRMEAPVGFRYLNVTNPTENGAPEIERIIVDLGCHLEISTGINGRPSNGDRFKNLAGLMGNKPGSAPECIVALKRILDEELKIDAFSYSYAGSSFAACQANGNSLQRTSAFVITSDRWLSRDRVRIFNAKTSDAREERLLIESMFYKSIYDDVAADRTSLPLQAYAYRSMTTRYPQQKFSTGFKFNAEKRTSQLEIKLCPPGISDQFDPSCAPVPVPKPNLSYPMTISESSPSEAMDLASYGAAIMWRDHEGKSTDPQIDAWIQASLFGCDREQTTKAYP